MRGWVGLQLQEAPLSTPSGAVLERKLVSVGTSQWPNGERIQGCAFESNPRYRGYPLGQPVIQTCIVHLQLQVGLMTVPILKMKGDRDHAMIIPLDQQSSHGGLPAATPELCTWLQWEEGLSPLWNEPGSCRDEDRWGESPETGSPE